MKRFVWRLQQVLDIKTQEEQARRSELVKVTERVAETRGELVMCERVLRELTAAVAAVGPEDRLLEQELFLKCSGPNDSQIKELKKRLRSLEAEQQEKMMEVLKVRRFKEGMERLRAEARRRFIEEQSRLEQKELDEMASVGFVRRSLSSAGLAK
jgi:flagellar biosynthesis chaperone FliJ